MASLWFHALLVLTLFCFVDATEGGSRANLRRHRATRTDRLSVDVVNATAEVEDSGISDGDADASEGTISNSTDLKEQSDFDSVTKALRAEEEEVETDDNVVTATEVQSEAKEIQAEDAEIEAQVAVDSKKTKDPLVKIAVGAAKHVHSALRADSAQKKARKAKSEAGARRATTAKHQKREHKAQNKKKTTKAAVADAKAVNVAKTSVKKQTVAERHVAKATVSQSDDEDEDVQADASDDESETNQGKSDSDSDARSESSSEDDSDQESSAVAVDEEDTPW